MRALVLAFVLLGVAGCGIDGPPTQPEGGIPDDGVASVGVVGTL